MTYTFYGVVDEYGGSYTASMDSKFYPSIDSVMLDREIPLEHGYLIEYVFALNHTTVPIRTRTYDVSTIEYYELHEYLEDSPEMNENNYLVYTVEVEGESDILTIVNLTGGTHDIKN
jgi:hypothetical protein